MRMKGIPETNQKKCVFRCRHSSVMSYHRHYTFVHVLIVKFWVALTEKQNVIRA